MVDFSEYKVGDKIQFLDKEELREVLKKYWYPHDHPFVQCIMNVAGETGIIKSIETDYFNKPTITLAGNTNFYAYKNNKGRWYFYEDMFQSKIENTINNDIPNIYGDMIYE